MKAKLPDIYDVIAIAGMGLLAYGLYLIRPELAYIVSGLALLALAVLGAWRKTRP